MKTKENLIRGNLKRGAITLSFMVFNALACGTTTQDNQPETANIVKEVTSKNTYLTAGVTRYLENLMINTNVFTNNISLKQNDFNIVKSSFGGIDVMSTPRISDSDNTESTLSMEQELDFLKEENVRLQQSVTHMEKMIDKYETDVIDLSDELDKTKKELRKYKNKEKNKKEVKHVAKLNTSDVRVLSGSSPETLNKLLEGTWLAGYGQKFYDNEQKYGVNALFSIGNAILETGWGGDNYLAKNKNNIYGLNMSRKFNSYEQCIDYWFNLISEHYVGEGYISMSAIQKKYCPPNANWDEQITSVTIRLRNKAGITIE